MPYYKYKAIDDEKVIKSGLVEAINEETAIDLLAEHGLSIVSLSEEAAAKHFNFAVLNRIKPKDLVVFSRQFSVMISANVAIVQALKILVDQTENVGLRLVISEISDEVDSGYRLSDCLAKRPNVFSKFYVSVIRSGEASGKLDEVLDYLADEMEKDYDMMSKIKGAMIYPAFVLTGMIVVGVMMMVFVVPKLTEVLLTTEGDLPFATRALMGISAFLVNFWWLVLMGLIALGVSLYYLLKTPSGQEKFNYLLLSMPIFGLLFQRIYLVRFTRSMTTLIVGGVTIVESLKVAAEVVGGGVYQKLITETIAKVEEGETISSVFNENPFVPKMVSQMIGIGERSGKLDVILEKITDFYTREINNVVANLMTLMEPIIMVVMGIGVGMMVAAIILPMYNMASSF